MLASFNSFPVVSSSSSSSTSCTSSPTFNSFPVVSGRRGKWGRWCGPWVFQFFPSCLTPTLWRGRRATRPFNSFPVVSHCGAGFGQRVEGVPFNSFPVVSGGLFPRLAYKLFFFSSEVGKTASHHPLAHERLLALPTSGFASPVSRRELLPCSLLKITFPTGSFWIK